MSILFIVSTMSSVLFLASKGGAPFIDEPIQLNVHFLSINCPFPIWIDIIAGLWSKPLSE